MRTCVQEWQMLRERSAAARARHTRKYSSRHTHSTHLAAVVCFSVVMQWICLPAGMCKEPKCFPVTDLIGAYCPLRQVPQSEIL